MITGKQKKYSDIKWYVFTSKPTGRVFLTKAKAMKRLGSSRTYRAGQKAYAFDATTMIVQGKEINRRILQVLKA